jgi:hypothetical protein
MMRLKVDLAEILVFVQKYNGFGGFVRGPAMDTRPSYYLQSNQDLFRNPMLRHGSLISATCLGSSPRMIMPRAKFGWQRAVEHCFVV